MGRIYTPIALFDNKIKYILIALIFCFIAITSNAQQFHQQLEASKKEFSKDQYCFFGSHASGGLDGCASICTEAPIIYTYTPKGFNNNDYNKVVDFEWLIEPSEAVEVIMNKKELLEIRLLQSTIENIQITYKAKDACGEMVTFIKNISIDDDCVLPGDTNKDGQISWLSDYSLLTLYKSHPNHPIVSNLTREAPCNDVSMSANFDIGLHPAEDWPSRFGGINAKHLDCDGDGRISSKNSTLYNPNDLLSIPIKDADVIQKNDAISRGLDNVSFWTSTARPILKIHTLPKTNTNDQRLRLVVQLGSPRVPVHNVHSLAFIVKFVLGPYRNPNIHFETTHLDDTVSLQKATYIIRDTAINGSDIAYAYVGMGRGDATTTVFRGEDVFRIICDMPIDGRTKDVNLLALPKNSIITNNLQKAEVQILGAAVRYENGRLEYVSADPTSTLREGLFEKELTTKTIKYYPNPSNGTFTIDAGINNETIGITIYNLLGERVYQEKNQTNVEGLVLVDTKQLLPEGKYLCKISTTTKVVTKKIIISK